MADTKAGREKKGRNKRYQQYMADVERTLAEEPEPPDDEVAED